LSGFARKMKRQNGVGYTPTPREAKMLQALHSASFVLKQYANTSNWTKTEAGMPVWLGEGDGPDLAQMVIGVKKNAKAVQNDDKNGQPVQEERAPEGEGDRVLATQADHIED